MLETSNVSGFHLCAIRGNHLHLSKHLMRIYYVIGTKHIYHIPPEEFATEHRPKHNVGISTYLEESNLKSRPVERGASTYILA